MIRNETEYKEAVDRLVEERGRLVEHRTRLKEAGLADEEIKRVIDPMESFNLQLQEEIETYERLKRGEFEELDNLRGLGYLIISLRIAKGISQRDLAKRLDIHESQVSRDERNEYFGITLERAIKILDALGVRLRTKVDFESPREMATAQSKLKGSSDFRPGRVCASGQRIIASMLRRVLILCAEMPSCKRRRSCRARRRPRR